MRSIRNVAMYRISRKEEHYRILARTVLIRAHLFQQKRYLKDVLNELKMSISDEAKLQGRPLEKRPPNPREEIIDWVRCCILPGTWLKTRENLRSSALRS